MPRSTPACPAGAVAALYERFSSRGEGGGGGGGGGEAGAAEGAAAAPRGADDCVIVIFGANGDLARRKLLPGLFHLQQEGLMPERFRIVGARARSWR